MARIAGVDLPSNKRVEVALTYIFGIGRSRAHEIIKESDVDPNTRVHNLTDDEIARLRGIIEKSYKIEGELRTETSMNIKRLIDIGSYRGLRHRKGLPLRGQRTRTNARTRKGKKKTVAGRKK
ncbi:MAG TPA: 30S ribosomal protein S13 [Spirochaetota bacterium]|nr:30S ribosomal protein S13 [Spirochaetota bacterium]